MNKSVMKLFFGFVVIFLLLCISSPIVQAQNNGNKSEKSPAVILVEYKEDLYATPSPYSNVGNPFWRFEVTFKETSGKTGYKVIKCDRYLMSASGDYYVMGNRYSNHDTIDININVEPGGRSVWNSQWIFGEMFIKATNKYVIYFEDNNGNLSNKTISFNMLVRD